MLINIANHVVVHQLLVLLESICQALLTDTVYNPWDARGDAENLIYGFIREGVQLSAAGVFHVSADILRRLRPIKVRQDAVDIDTLTDGSIALEAQLFIPQFGLSDEDESHGVH